MLMKSELSDRIYIVTRYKIIDEKTGRFRSQIKYDVTDEFNALVKKINSKTSHNNDLKKVCLQCGGTGIMGNEETNAECDSCHGTGKPIIES